MTLPPCAEHQLSFPAIVWCGSAAWKRPSILRRIWCRIRGVPIPTRPAPRPGENHFVVARSCHVCGFVSLFVSGDGIMWTPRPDTVAVDSTEVQCPPPACR